MRSMPKKKFPKILSMVSTIKLVEITLKKKACTEKIDTRIKNLRSFYFSFQNNLKVTKSQNKE